MNVIICDNRFLPGESERTSTDINLSRCCRYCWYCRCWRGSSLAKQAVFSIYIYMHICIYILKCISVFSPARPLLRTLFNCAILVRMPSGTRPVPTSVCSAYLVGLSSRWDHSRGTLLLILLAAVSMVSVVARLKETLSLRRYCPLAGKSGSRQEFSQGASPVEPPVFRPS